MATATPTRRRNNTITKFLQDIVDDSKDLVDDLIERAQDAEDSVRDAVIDVVDDKDEDEVTDVADLQKALAELSAKVDKLAKTK
jgi:polyhydroxyalkanoate synthesis regulator phasin